MNLSINLVNAMQDVVLQPNLVSALILFATSFVNELFSIFPYVVVLSGQLLFLEEPFSITIITKLFFLVSIPVGIGATLGSMPFYVLAYFGGKPAIDKLGGYVRLSWDDVERMELRFKGSWYDDILFLFLRSVPFLPHLPLSVVAGILRMRLAPYLVLTVIGATIRIMIMFLFIGFGMEALAQ